MSDRRTAARFSAAVRERAARLAGAGIEPSVGSVGDSWDNALAETVIGLFKTESIHPRGPWRSLDAVAFTTLEWVDWFNHRRLLEPIGSIPPAEAEARDYDKARALPLAASLKPELPPADTERFTRPPMPRRPGKHRLREIVTRRGESHPNPTRQILSGWIGSENQYHKVTISNPQHMND